MIMNGDYAEPINLGSSELVSINQLVDIVEEIAGLNLKRRYNLSAPKGVNGRNSDNSVNSESLPLGAFHSIEGWNGTHLPVIQYR